MKNKRQSFDKLRTSGIVALFIAMSVPASAQEIIVTGAPLPSLAGLEAYGAVEIEEARIQSVASGRIEDALRDVAGLQQFRRTDARSANATSQGATLRGLGGNASSRALLVLDGVPQSDPFGGWVSWPAYAANRIGSVRVTRGGGSGAYGSGALSGTIELESITMGKAGRKEVSMAYGSRNSMDASALLSGRLGQGAALISVSYARGDGFIPIIKRQRGTADTRAPYEQASLAARGVVPLGSDTELQASILAFTDRRTRGTILSGNGGDGADAALRLVRDAGEGQWAYEATLYVQARKFQSRFVSINAARSTVLQTVDQYNVPSTGLGARFEVRPPLPFALRIGGDWRRVAGETNELFTFVAGQPTRLREAGGSADTLGAFAEASLPLGDRLELTASGRADHWRLGAGRLTERTIATGASLRNDLSPARTGWEGTGRAGIVWRAGGGWKARGAVYKGWRLPTLNELYRPFRVGADATADNPLLSPERMRGAEIGLSWQRRPQAYVTGDDREQWLMTFDPSVPISFSITAFTNRLDDAIGNVTLGAGPGVFPGVGFVATGGAYRQRLNLDAIRSKGIELDARIRSGDWHAQASYAYTDARVRASGAALPLNELRPAQVPKHLASATLGWRGLSLTGRYVSAQFEDDANVRRLRDAVTLDAISEVPISERFSLFARGENLTNARVEAAISGNGVIERASPRTLWIGIRMFADK